MLRVELRKKLGVLDIRAEFHLDGREILALFGPSGAGKTSVVNMIAGLLKPDTGRIVAHDRTLFDAEKRLSLPPHQRRIGCIFQDGRLFPHLTVRSNLLYGWKRTPPSERYIDFETVLSVLGIDHLLERRPANLSGGEKQRVAIGRALLTSPRLLLMDEPLTSVDEARKADILSLAATIPGKFGVPILYVSHDLSELEALSARVVIVSGGAARE